MVEFILVIILGALIGISSALLGLGGNILIVPLLPLITELSLKQVVATGIFTVMLVTFVNVISFYRNKLLDFKLAALLVIPTMGLSFLSSHYLKIVDEKIIKTLLIVVMVLMALRLFIPLRKMSMSLNLKYTLLVLAGVISGTLAGLTGVGTGVLLAPLMLIFQVTDEKKISPTINLLIFLACLSASSNFFSFQEFNFPLAGQVRIDYVLALFLPALISAKFGRKINLSISSKLRTRVVASVLLILITKMLLMT